MGDSDSTGYLEEQLQQWRSSVGRGRGTDTVDVARLERRLREEYTNLLHAGLAGDEAFLVAMKRVATLDPRSRDFAREHLHHVWQASGVLTAASGAGDPTGRREAAVAVGFAVMAAVALKVPALFGIETYTDGGFYARNASLFVLPCLTAYFIWKRQTARGTIGWLATAFVAAVVFANLTAFGRTHEFEPLTALHLPIALWLAAGVAYAGGRWSQPAGRMDFIRFSGELFIYYVLIALGGGVLTGFMTLTFHSIGMNIQRFLDSWLLPCGAAGAVVVASWLVEAKQGVLENMAPVLTRLFTPLFAAMLIAFLGALLLSGHGVAIERNLLIGFDLLLVVVLGLLLYSLSARERDAEPGPFDVLQVVLLISALLADLVALRAIGARISEFGFTPNRVAALGENVILLVNLGWSTGLYLRFLLRRGSLVSLERWQTGFLPVYSAWAAVVVVVFPPVFRWLG